MRTNPNKIMTTLHTYRSPSGKEFPVIVIETAPGKAICLPVGNMPLTLRPDQLTLGVVL